MFCHKIKISLSERGHFSLLMLVACRCHHPQSWLHPSNLAHEEGLKRAGSVVPPETLAVSVPQLETVLLFTILISEIRKYLSGPDMILSFISFIDHESLFLTPFSPSPVIINQIRYKNDSLEVVGLPGVPVFVGDGFTGGHPEELALLGLVSA